MSEEQTSTAIVERSKAMVKRKDFASVRKMYNKLYQQAMNDNLILDTINRDDVKEWLRSPANYERQLRDLSRSLFIRSHRYRRAILYLAQLPQMYWTLLLYDKASKGNKTLVNALQEASKAIEKMNIAHEFKNKILVRAFREDVYYGYEHETRDQYYIQTLDPNYCRISSIEDGCFNLAFNFAYFDVTGNNVKEWPDEFRKKYNEYKREKKMGKMVDSWKELDSKKTICIKINEDTVDVIPPFVGIFDKLFDIEEYEASRKARDKMGNFHLIWQTIPLKKDSENVNDFLIDEDFFQFFDEQLKAVAPEEFGIVTSPMKPEALSFKIDDFDNVEKGVRDFWGALGISELLFSGEKATGSSLHLSVKTDEEVVFAVLRQIERWINRKVKRLYPNFRVRILDTTAFNHKEVFDKTLSAAQNGVPVKMMLGALLGYPPSMMNNMLELENEILKLDEKMVPLANSHTQSAMDKGGRPKKEDGDLSDEGVKTRDGEKNDNRLN